MSIVLAVIYQMNVSITWHAKCWVKCLDTDDIAVHTQTKSFQLGLCPELAYHNMITTALWEKSNDKFWQQQMEMDLWIHQILDNL